jgi:hypothetical protein
MGKDLLPHNVGTPPSRRVGAVLIGITLVNPLLFVSLAWYAISVCRPSLGPKCLFTESSLICIILCLYIYCLKIPPNFELFPNVQLTHRAIYIYCNMTSKESTPHQLQLNVDTF